MRCVCGYVKLQDWDEKIINPDGKDFIKLDIQCYRDHEANEGGTFSEKERVFACPKCGTLKIDI